MKKKTIIILGMILLCLIALLLFLNNKPTKIPAVSDVVTTSSILKDGRQCYTYSHDATKDEPYTVTEFIDMTVSGATLTGTKRGTQSGPDMTNGYTGTLMGTIDNDTINALFSYVIEGSPNKEKEIYKARTDLIGIEKLRYPLIEEKGMLVPDTTKPFTSLLYARVGCTASN